MLEKTVMAILVLLSLAGCNNKTALPLTGSELLYKTDVRTWWSNHRFNPESKQYAPKIKSPEKKIVLKEGVKIQNAIDNLDQNGGTIILNPGEYEGFTIINKQNLHFIADDEVFITTPVIIYGCEQCRDYGQFSFCAHARDEKCLDCLHNQPTRNIYFKDIIFKSNVTCRTSKSVMWDKCTFTGPRNSAHAVNNNLWYRQCDFIGIEAIAVYWDGVHEGGFINCKFGDQYSEMLFLGFTNDDFTWDYNNDGVWSGHEVRKLAYVVFYGNEFGPVNQFAAVYAGSNLLMKCNKTTGPMRDFVMVNGKHAAKDYTFTSDDIVITCNDVPHVKNLLHLQGPHNRPSKEENPNLQDWYVWTKYNIGGHTVTNNRIGDNTKVVWEDIRDGRLIPPLEISNNTPETTVRTCCKKQASMK